MPTAPTETEISFTLDGDLNQMSIQKQHIDRLQDLGIRMTKEDVYHTVHGTPEQIKKVLESFWKNRILGWWNYRTELVVDYRICTDTVFRAALRDED